MSMRRHARPNARERASEQVTQVCASKSRRAHVCARARDAGMRERVTPCACARQNTPQRCQKKKEKQKHAQARARARASLQARKTALPCPTFTTGHILQHASTCHTCVCHHRTLAPLSRVLDVTSSRVTYHHIPSHTHTITHHHTHTHHRTPSRHHPYIMRRRVSLSHAPSEASTTMSPSSRS